MLLIRLYNGYISSVCRQRPSHVESTGSRPITEVKQHRARASSVTTERFLQPRRLDPSILGASHHRHIQLQRHCGVSSGTRLGSKTQILPGSPTHIEQTTQRPIVQLTDAQAHSEHRFPAPSSKGRMFLKEGCRKPVLGVWRSWSSTCKQWVSTANTSRPIGDSPSDLGRAPPPPPPSPPLELTGRPSWGRKQHVHGHIQISRTAKPERKLFLVTGDTCSPEDLGTTPVSGRRYEHEFDYAVGNHWLCFHSVVPSV